MLQLLLRQMSAVLVKICGIMDEPALSAAAEAGADYIGFVFVSHSKRFVTPQFAEKLSDAKPEGLKVVGLFQNPTDAEINGALRATHLDVIQLHGQETPERVAEIKALTQLCVMKALPVTTAQDLKVLPAYEAVADMILLDAQTSEGVFGGGGVCFDWSLLSNVTFKKPWMLAGGLTPDNVQDALRATGAAGVDVSSGVERFEVKDSALIRAFVQNAKRWR